MTNIEQGNFGVDSPPVYILMQQLEEAIEKASESLTVAEITGALEVTKQVFIHNNIVYEQE